MFKKNRGILILKNFFKTPKGEKIYNYLLILIGTSLGALAYPLFLIPHKIAPGGVTGLATVIHAIYSPLPVGITSLALNVPLFIFGYKYMGKRFVFRTLIATIIFSILIDIFSFLPPLTKNPMMAAIFGGFLLGSGLALILFGGATTGGTDMLARLLHEKFSGISIGSFLLLFDFIVVSLAGIFIDIESAMNAVIAVFISSRIIDTILSGVGASKACYVISKKHDEIASRILQDIKRGATIIPAYGAYSKSESKMLLCIAGRMEVVAIKHIVKDIDPEAFMFITETKETLGQGFLKLG